MWLLNVRTRRLEQFIDDRTVIGKYAILSHTWGEDEVTFDDIHTAEAAKKQGYLKIEYTCTQAHQDGLEYAWVDTCCIDKRSSAELSQAINSMYRWYYNAQVCYAYLFDFRLKGHIAMFTAERFRQCRWFGRGWTLQELIAPRNVIFFDFSWTQLESRTKLARILANITHIDENVLINRDHMHGASVANRMSWAACRRTTQVEDQAYSLLGIFDINMPLLYGEGTKAFQRLQEEIIRTWSTVDHSILAWHGTSGGLFASSPSQFPVYFPDESPFAPSKRDIISWSLPHNEVLELSNKGLRISLYARCAEAQRKMQTDKVDYHESREPDVHEAEKVVVVLNCTYTLTKDQCLAFHLRRRPYIAAGGYGSERSPQVDEKYAIYDFEPAYGLVNETDLRHFTPTTLLIARYKYKAPLRLIDVKLTIKSGCTYQLTDSAPASQWKDYGDYMMWHVRDSYIFASAKAALLVKNRDQEMILELLLSRTRSLYYHGLPTLLARLHLAKNCHLETQYHESLQECEILLPPGDALHAFDAPYEVLQSGSSLTLHENGWPFLQLHGKYVFLTGSVIWDVTLSEVSPRTRWEFQPPESADHAMKPLDYHHDLKAVIQTIRSSSKD